MIDELKLYKKPDSSTKICTLLVCTVNSPYLPFKLGEHVLWLGEIPGMKGHCAVTDTIGRVHWALHNHDFGILPEDKI
jgi:hypothetical protein